MIVRSHIGFKTASIAFQFCCCFHTMHSMFYMTAASYHVVRWLLLPAPCAAMSVISRHARPQNMMPMRLLDDHTLFVDNLFEANRRTLNSTKYELIHGTPKLILELNMVAEQNAAEPSLRRARTAKRTAMEVDLPDDDDDLGEPTTTTLPPPPTAQANPTSTTIPSSSMTRRMDPKLLDKPEGFDGTGTSWRVWKLRVSGWLCAVDVRFRRLLPEAEKSEAILENVDENVLTLDTFLYTQLLVWLEGEQLETLLRGPENHGFEAWRTLVRAQERLEPTRKVMQLEKLLHPHFGDRTTWRREW